MREYVKLVHLPRKYTAFRYFDTLENERVFNILIECVEEHGLDRIVEIRQTGGSNSWLATPNTKYNWTLQYLYELVVLFLYVIRKSTPGWAPDYPLQLVCGSLSLVTTFEGAQDTIEILSAAKPVTLEIVTAIQKFIICQTLLRVLKMNNSWRLCVGDDSHPDFMQYCPALKVTDERKVFCVLYLERK